MLLISLLFFFFILTDPETGRSKGFGFIQYKNSEDAKQALEKMNGFELAGRNVSSLSFEPNLYIFSY